MLRFLFISVSSFFILFSFHTSVVAASKSNGLIVKLKAGKKLDSLQESLQSLVVSVQADSVRAVHTGSRLYVVRSLSVTQSNQLRSDLQKDDAIEYVVPNFILTLRAKKKLPLPNDTHLDKQWNMHNNRGKGSVSAGLAWRGDMDGKDALGNDVVIGVVDGGFMLEHPELRDNLWVNPKEIAGNGLDDDGNGVVDDIHGIKAADNTGNLPVNAHGTHVAGIMAAKGNNDIGVAGINWNTKIIFGSIETAETAEVMRAYGYMLDQKRAYLSSNGEAGANVVAINSSFGIDRADCNSPDYRPWNEMFDALGAVGVISVGATANAAFNIDKTGDVPTACDSEFLISVTNSTAQDKIHSSAGFGRRTIDLAAPGDEIFSTMPDKLPPTFPVPLEEDDPKYGRMTGTSMATPHVTGAVGFLYASAPKAFSELAHKLPAEAARRVKRAILSSVDKIDSMRGRTVSGGRLNLHKAVLRISK